MALTDAKLVSCTIYERCIGWVFHISQVDVEIPVTCNYEYDFRTPLTGFPPPRSSRRGVIDTNRPLLPALSDILNSTRGTMLSSSALEIIGVFLIANFLRQALSSPLNRLPGPWFAKFTSLVLKWHEFRAQRTRYVHSLHLQFGPAVRIAPNEAAFASAAAVKEIYCSGGSGYDKTEFYDLFKVYGRRTMFTTLNKEDVSGAYQFRIPWYCLCADRDPCAARKEKTHAG